VVVASEPPAFELIGATYVRDIEPGEMIVVDKFGLRTLRPFKGKPREHRMCVFEYVYFARPDAELNGVSVYAARKRMGHALAKDQPADVDVVVPVPD
jgi:amidophosphoribosyltransferase